MTISLYDISVASYLQTVGAIAGILDKGSAHFAEHCVDPDGIVQTRLHPDMLPFSFQVHSVVHHSLGALKGLESGEFGPPAGLADLDYAGFQRLVAETLAALERYTPDAVNALQGGDVSFVLGEHKLPFTAEEFVLSFSLPNLHFHAATAYDILRMQGVPLGKRDFMGRLRMKR
jgi:uncharacterized protein